MIYQLIRGIKVFDSVSDDTLRTLAESMSMVSLGSGEYLLKQGELADCMYILAQGRLLVTVTNNHGVEHKVGEIGVGDIVGEMSLLTDMPRSASVRAVRDCRLVVIERSLFRSLVKDHAQAAMGIVSACVKRLLPNFTEKKHGVKSLCILPCDAAVNVKDFTLKMADALQKYISIKIIDPKDPEFLQRYSQDSSALHTWLTEQEQSHDLLVYVTDNKLDDFARLAISQSDKILRVTTPRADLNKQLVDYVNQSPSILAEKYLIIVHESATKLPEGTADLLREMPCTEHFHVAQKADYERVARYMLGRSISLVFSGGGLRGIAHQGLVAAFHERGIPIDMTGGTSFGALPTVFCGLRMSPDEMLEVWKSMVPKIKKIVDLTLPLAAIGKGEVLYEILTSAIPSSICLEDLWIPTFCVSTNITNFATNMQTSGPAWLAVRASMSIPGIFPPVIHHSDVLVDGASMNNLPVDLMGTINNQGTIIASVASGKPGHMHYAGYGKSLSGWRMLSKIFNPHQEPLVPSIVETMLTASLAASTLHQERMCAAADYTFDLGVDKYKLLDIVHWEEIRETGYETALRLIDEYGLKP